MFYIFDVANGSMLTFDVQLAFHNVSKLKAEIERRCNIRASHQVLLMSGGESLEPNAQIWSYSTGTDTNPVYLLSKLANDATSPTSSSASASTATSEQDEMPNCDLQNQVYESENMVGCYKTFLKRKQIAQEFLEMARQQSRICGALVQDQHFQQQGWSAVVAHLEDVVQSCKSNVTILENNFDTYIADHQEHLDILKNLDEVVEVLEKIPVLPGLRERCLDTSSLLTDETKNSREQSVQELTLLNWISGQRLKHLSDQCSRGLKRLDNRTMGALQQELDAAMEAANEQNLKEIKRVCERLFSLEHMMSQMKQLLQDQAKLVQKFQDDLKRVTDLTDEGTIADMCLSHHDWLLLMLQNHNELRDIWRRCSKAKEKLCVSIRRRLERVVEVENKIVEMEGKVVMYNDSLTRLCKELEILRQVHLTPEMYVSAVVEVVRRRNFSHAFLAWSNDLVSEMQTLHNQELERRKEFLSKFKGHFLNELFSGLEDVPPPFATEAPATFDDTLPNLTIDDLNSLKDQLPNLDFSFSIPNLNTTAVSFFSKDMAGIRGTEDMGCKRLNDTTIEPVYTKSFIQNYHSIMKSFLVESKRDVHSESDYNITNIIQSFDESLKIRTRKLCEERQGLRVVNEFELLDFKNLLQTREEKIRSLKLLIVEKEAESKNDHLLHLMKQKLKFEQESMVKLQLIYKEIELKRTQAKVYQEKLMKETKEVKMLESTFKSCLDRYEKKSKELYDEESLLL